MDLLQEIDDVLLLHRCFARISAEAATPVVGAEGFRCPLRPYFQTAVGDHGEGERIQARLGQFRSQYIRITLRIRPLKEDVDSVELTFSGGARRKCRGLGNACSALVANRLQGVGFLAQARNNGIRKLLGPDPLPTHAFTVDVVGVDALLDRLEPGVVDTFGYLRPANVHHHHDSALEETGWVGHVLSRRGAGRSRG